MPRKSIPMFNEDLRDSIRDGGLTEPFVLTARPPSGETILIGAMIVAGVSPSMIDKVLEQYSADLFKHKREEAIRKAEYKATREANHRRSTMLDMVRDFKEKENERAFLLKSGSTLNEAINPAL